MNKHIKAFQEKKLKSGEEILDGMEGYIGEMMGKGRDTQYNGALILTNNRVVFYRKGFFGEVIRNIPLAKISSIDVDTMLGHKTIEFHTSHDSIRFKTFLEVDQFVENTEGAKA